MNHLSGGFRAAWLGTLPGVAPEAVSVAGVAASKAVSVPCVAANAAVLAGTNPAMSLLSQSANQRRHRAPCIRYPTRASSFRRRQQRATGADREDW